MKARKRVALLVAPGWYGSERLARGVQAYARECGDWKIVSVPESFSGSLRDLDQWKGDGIIAAVKSPQDAQMAADLSMPVVGVSGVLKPGLLPRVLTDNEAIGRLGASHLLNCGFRRLAFIGRRGADDVARRRQGFLDGAAVLHASVATFLTPSLLATWKSWNQNATRLARFVAELPTPVGIMACDDVRARMLLEACDSLGLRVPDDVAIIGVDNNRPVSEYSDPSLSSIARPDEDMGYEAAALLNELMTGGDVPCTDLLLPPAGVIERRSTDVLAVEDPHVRTVLLYIRDYSLEPFGVERLATLVPISRRWLESSFRSIMGCTLHQHLCRTRVEKAKELLLLTPKKTLCEIAEACGFTNPKRFRLVFERIAGTQPNAYRAEQQGTS